MSRYAPLVPFARRSLLTLVVPVTLLVLGGCAKDLKMENVQNSVKEGIERKMGMPMSSVTCPPVPRKAKEGDTFTCTGSPAVGGSLTLQITQKDDQGKVDWTVTKISGVFDMQPAEAAVKQELELQGEIITGVSCGTRWQAGKAGSRFDCRTEFGDGQTATLVVTAKDADGKVWAME